MINNYKEKYYKYKNKYLNSKLLTLKLIHESQGNQLLSFGGAIKKKKIIDDKDEKVNMTAIFDKVLRTN